MILAERKAAIVSFTIDGLNAESVRLALARQGINVSSSPPSSTLLDATARHLPAVARASPHYYNSEDEINQLVAACRKLATSRRR